MIFFFTISLCGGRPAGAKLFKYSTGNLAASSSLVVVSALKNTCSGPTKHCDTTMLFVVSTVELLGAKIARFSTVSSWVSVH